MSRMGRDLGLQEHGGEDSESPWPVFSDVALALLLVFTLFILAQFLHYDEVFILEQLRTRQEQVRTAILDGVGEAQHRAVDVVSVDEYHQRITFQAELLFEACGSNVRSEGRGLVEAVGAALRPHLAYFETVQVEGHTDMRAPGRLCLVLDNWALSSDRATAVVRILAGPTALGDPPRLSAVGRGEFHPVGVILSSDTTSAALARHRRIELVLQYTDRGILNGSR